MSKLQDKKKTETVEALTDKYKLSPAGGQLLDVMLDPMYRFKNVSEKCQIAGISRDSYYRLIDQEPFQKALQDGSRAILVSYAPGCATSMGEAGIRGDFQSAKEILKQSGIIDDVTSVDVNHTGEQTITLKDIISQRKKD